jgi:CTP:phosphocholine cytidylyltransferase-like protein
VSYRLNRLKDWTATVISLDPAARSLFFNSTGESIKLQNYLIRYSKCKERNAFVLECSSGKSFYETVRISHANYLVFEDLQTKVKNIVVGSLRERILSMMNLCKKSNELSTKSKLTKRESLSVAVIRGKERRSLRDLIQQSTANLSFTIDDYNAIAGTLVNEDIVANMDNFGEY